MEFSASTDIKDLPVLKRNGQFVTYGNFIAFVGNAFIVVDEMVVEYPSTPWHSLETTYADNQMTITANAIAPKVISLKAK